MLLIGAAAFSQQKVDSFKKVMTAKPLGKDVEIIDVKYNKGQFVSFQEKTVRFKKPNAKARAYYKSVGKPIDENNIINYKSDTIYTLYTPAPLPLIGAEGTLVIKTQKGRFRISINLDETFSLTSIDEGEDDIFSLNTGLWEDECRKKSDNLLYSAVFNWDFELLERIIKASGGGPINQGNITSRRIIIYNNEVISKEVLKFEPAFRWTL